MKIDALRELLPSEGKGDGERRSMVASSLKTREIP